MKASVTHIEDPRLPLPSHSRPANYISLADITQALQSRDVSSHPEGINIRLNDSTRLQQSITLEEKLVQYSERFKNAPNGAKDHMLHEINRKLDRLGREEDLHADVHVLKKCVNSAPLAVYQSAVL